MSLGKGVRIESALFYVVQAKGSIKKIHLNIINQHQLLEKNPKCIEKEHLHFWKKVMFSFTSSFERFTSCHQNERKQEVL